MLERQTPNSVELADLLSLNAEQDTREQWLRRLLKHPRVRPLCLPLCKRSPRTTPVTQVPSELCRNLVYEDGGAVLEGGAPLLTVRFEVSRFVDGSETVVESLGERGFERLPRGEGVGRPGVPQHILSDDDAPKSPVCSKDP